MNYIILIILLATFIYYKYNQLNDKYSNSVNKIEKFSNLYELKDKGLLMDTPFSKKITLLTDQTYNPMFYLGSILETFEQDLGNKESFGSQENIKLVNQGDAEFGMCNEKIFVDSFLGNNESIQTPNLEFVMAFYTEHIYIISKKQNTLLSDLEKKHVWIGSIQNSGFFYLKLFAKIKGYDLERWNKNNDNNKSKVIYFSEGSLTDALIEIKKDNSNIDTLFIVSGPKLSYLMDLNNNIIGRKNKYIVSEITNYYFESIMGSLLKKNSLNVDIYSDPSKNHKNLYGSRVVLFCHKKMDPEYVYNLVKNIVQNKQFLTESMYKWGKQTFDDDLQDFAYHYKFDVPDMLSCPPNIKIHDGTRKYLKEIGLITNDPTQICEFDYEKNRCQDTNIEGFSKKPIWKLQEVQYLN